MKRKNAGGHNHQQGGGGVGGGGGSSSSRNLYPCGIPECERPCYTRNGIVHDFCGRAHAKEAVERGLLDVLYPPHGVCHKCQLDGCNKDVYYEHETGRVHDFCCRRHADVAMSRREWPPEASKGSAECRLSGCREVVYRDPATGEESDYCSNRHYVAGKAEQARQCVRNGCEKSAWVDEHSGSVLAYCGSSCAVKSGERHLCGTATCSLPGCPLSTLIDPTTRSDLGYCCEEHRLRGTQRYLAPRAEPHVDRTFRGGTTSATDFQLSALTKRHQDYQSLKGRFLSKWVKPEPANGVSVVRIFKVQVPADIQTKHHEYQQFIGNVRRRFHGTSCHDLCNFFVDLKGGPCGEQACSVCNICTHGFKLMGNAGRTAQLTNVSLRYGEGLYFSSVSGKANDYATWSEKRDRQNRRVRCMFVASVAVGKPYATYQGRLTPDLCPPEGFNSVVGQVGPHLNYDEVVVYHDAAAIPSHLIVYTLND